MLMKISVAITAALLFKCVNTGAAVCGHDTLRSCVCVFSEGSVCDAGGSSPFTAVIFNVAFQERTAGKTTNQELKYPSVHSHKVKSKAVHVDMCACAFI